MVFLRKLGQKNWLGNTVLDIYLKNSVIFKYFKIPEILNYFLINPYNKQAGKIINVLLKKEIMSLKDLEELIRFKVERGNFKIIQNINAINNLSFLPFESLFFAKNLNVENLELLYKQAKEKKTVGVFKEFITQDRFLHLSFKDEIIEKYLADYEVMLKKFINTGGLGYSFIRNYLNVFYNLKDLQYINLIQERLSEINNKFKNYKVTESLNSIIEIFTFYSPTKRREESLPDFLQNNIKYIYLVNPKFISIEEIFDYTEYFLFEENEKFKIIAAKLLLLFNYYDLNTIYLDNPAERRKKINILFFDYIWNLVEFINEKYTIEDSLKYAVARLFQKYEVELTLNADSDARDDDYDVIEFLFNTLSKKDFEGISPYYINLIYLYIKKFYKNKYKNELIKFIEKYNLYKPFLQSKYIFKEFNLIKSLLKKKKFFSFKTKDEYLKNPYFEIKKQIKFFKKIKNKDKKIFLKNNPNIDILLLQTNKKYVDIVLKHNENFIKKLLFS